MPVALPHGPSFYERTEVGLPLTVTNMDRITKRPVLANRLELILCHYTGVPVATRQYKFLTLAQKIVIIKSINEWKRNEYNYLIFQDGTIFEFAGRFQAIHCGPWPIGRSWNNVSYGMLFVNAVEEPITWDQISSFGWLKNVMRWTQQVAQDVEVQPHKWAKPTGCPGDSIVEAIPGLRGL